MTERPPHAAPAVAVAAALATDLERGLSSVEAASVSYTHLTLPTNREV